MDIQVVPAKPEDARDLQEVFYKTWLNTYPNKEFGITVDDIEFFYKDAFSAKTIAERAEKLALLPNNMKVFVAKEGTKTVGLSRVTLHPNKNQLQAIYILPSYQKKGIGMMLWNAAKSVFDPTKDTMVEVATYNENAIAFYKKLGFQDTGRRFSNEKFRFKSGSIIPEMEMIIPAKN